jgi:antirestriction protein ArdC
MPNTPQPSRTDIYETITNTILAAIENEPGDPIMPWQRGGTCPVLPTNAVTGQTYRGVNILSLWVAALQRGYGSGAWATLRQWNEKGATVRKGEKAAPIVFYRETTVETDSNANGDDKDSERRFLARGYWVFAAEQVDGYAVATELPSNPIERIATAEAYFKATGAVISIGGAQAYYRPATDTIHMPDEARFFESDGRTRTAAWYAVLGHEATHWVGAPRRLNRDFGKRFGDNAYCFEEATAELGACFLCARLGIAAAPHPDHARYIYHWLTVMKANPRAIFAAAAKAQEAIAFLDGLQTTSVVRAAA